MAVETVKDATIAALDATPRVVPTTGKGAPGMLKVVNGHATTVASSSDGSTYQLCRVPFSAKVKQVVWESGAQAAGTINVGVYYATDGSNALSKAALLVADTIDEDFFASLLAVTSAIARTDITNEGGFYPPSERDLPLWQAVGLSADPGGNADIVATVDTALTTAATEIGLTIFYVD
ncbi:MAG: hypothetical protein E6Q97_28355 [Desulfurellales bacterium]|nr:MAG: hypothetical protein E6Q97_28355 [Desulfurellales bacterium]